MAGFSAFINEITGTKVGNGVIFLDRSESHHLVKVRRARKSAQVSVLDGKGHIWTCCLDKPNPERAVLSIRNEQIFSRPDPQTILGISVLSGKTMDWVVQKATELGVSRIVPLVSQNSEVKLDEKRAHRRLEKWKSVAIESCKQCGNPHLPGILPFMEVTAFCEELTSSPTACYVAALVEDTDKLWQALESTANEKNPFPHQLALAVGPEGDFSSEEYSCFRKHGFKMVNLGPHILRAETAAIVSIGVVNEWIRTRV